MTARAGRGHTLAFGASAPSGVAVTEATSGNSPEVLAHEGTLDAQSPVGPAEAAAPPSRCIACDEGDPFADCTCPEIIAAADAMAQIAERALAKMPPGAARAAVERFTARTITPEQGARLGSYCAEKDFLADNGWDVRFRVQLRTALGCSAEQGGPAITAEIQEPCDALAVAGGKSAGRYTAWSLGDEKQQARREVDRAAAVYFERTSRALSWDTPLWMTHPLWLVFYAAWRDHYEGRLPPGWPFQGAGQVS